MCAREGLRTAQYDLTGSRLDALSDSVRNADSPSVLRVRSCSLDVSHRSFGKMAEPVDDRVRTESIMLLSSGYEQNVLEQPISVSATIRKVPRPKFAHAHEPGDQHGARLD